MTNALAYTQSTSYHAGQHHKSENSNPLIKLESVRRVVFTTLHGMQTRYSDEKAVRPSVCQTPAL